MSRQYIYTIERLTKKHGQREVLKDIWLAFYPGAKIGVLGRNGAGKSTLLRIMAGVDKDFDGEARITDGFIATVVIENPNQSVLSWSLTHRQALDMLEYFDKQPNAVATKRLIALRDWWQ